MGFGWLEPMLLREKDVYVPDTVRQLVLEALHSRRFAKVRDVVAALARSGVPESVTLRAIQDLAREGKVVLNLPGAAEAVMTPVPSFASYLRSALALDLWATLLLLALGITTMFTIPSDLFPLVMVRWVFASLLLVFVPGFAFVRALYPFDRFIDRWERLALSSGLSIALAILVSFALNFTPWGITPAPTATALALITISSILVATYRRARVLVAQ
jgi:hypothetical protein